MLTLLVTMPLGAQPLSQSPKDAAALARRTAAERLGIPVDRLQVITTTRAEWRDSSLGCPERGMMYTPALVSGYKVTLRDGERIHVVHVGAGTAVLCGSRTDSKLSTGAIVGPALKASQVVRQALAARAGVDPSSVRIVSAKPAASAPCAAAPKTPTGAAFIVDAEAGGQSYRYYTDDRITVACDAPPRDKKRAR